jgi:hypothetical protein
MARAAKKNCARVFTASGGVRFRSRVLNRQFFQCRAKMKRLLEMLFAKEKQLSLYFFSLL